MTKREWAEQNKANLSGADLCGAHLSGADLRDADLCGAHLRTANLYDANLCGADLRGADMRWAHLRGADLRATNLMDADLRDADLRDADLRGARLRGANLRGAYLMDADLRGSNLCGAQVAGVRWPSPTMVLSASWGDLEADDLANSCMHLDMSGHPDPSAFERWAKGGECPYDGCNVTQIVNFVPRPWQWRKESKNRLTIYQIMEAVLAEQCGTD